MVSRALAIDNGPCRLNWFPNQHDAIKRSYRFDLYILWLQDIANTEKLRFTNESVAVREEAAKLKSQGVNIIIVLSHCGLDVDYIIAKNAGPDVDVIVGGHTHTFMYTNISGERPPGPDTPKDNYPAVVTHADGHKVLIVQASAYLKYVGDITVFFDKNGRVVSWEGAPIFLDTNVEQGMSAQVVDASVVSHRRCRIHILVFRDQIPRLSKNWYHGEKWLANKAIKWLATYAFHWWSHSAAIRNAIWGMLLPIRTFTTMQRPCQRQWALGHQRRLPL